MCVQACLRECLLLSTAGHIWSVANAASSLAVLPADSAPEAGSTSGGGAQEPSSPSPSRQPLWQHQPPRLWDLRSPLGVPPAARAREHELREQQQHAEEEVQRRELAVVERAHVPLSKLLQDRCVAVRGEMFSCSCVCVCVCVCESLRT